MTSFDFPKIDLHLHLDGALSYDFLYKMALEHGMNLSMDQIRSSVSVSPECRNLVEYLNCFELPTVFLQKEHALTLATFDLISHLEAQGLYYADLRFAPQRHTLEGLSQQQAVEAVLKGLEMAKQQNFKIKIGILLCLFVTGPENANRETTELAIAYKGKGVVGLDIAGPEGAVPMSEYKTFFHRASQAGLPFTIHAGECGDYNNIMEAVSFGARRIGHGWAACKSEECMKLLEKEQIILEVCPTSNLQTKAVNSIAEHPIRMLFDRGIMVTVNTDNMTVSDTTLQKEYELLMKHCHFTTAELVRMSEYSQKGIF